MALLSKRAVSDRSTYWQLAVIYMLSAMGAYQISSIPIQWIGSALAVFFMLVSLFDNREYHRVYLYPIFLILLVFLFSIAGWIRWAQVIDFQYLHAVGSSTSYLTFIFLRYFQFIAFISVYLVSIQFLELNGFEKLAQLLMVCGVLVSIYAIYVYVAQMLGLWELPRNRMGTGGGDQAVVFTYAFHRAIGPFREPSHLAQWLIIPLFMTFVKRSYWYTAARLLIVSTVLITGSLTGILAIGIGYTLSLFTTLSIRKALIRLLGFAGILLVATAVFTELASLNPWGSVDVWGVIIDRMSPIIFGGGLMESNRAYVYEFVSKNPFPVIGYGLGNGNILFGESQGIGLIGSFLSLPVNMLYALGYIGVVVIVVFLLTPLFVLSRYRTRDPRYLYALLAAYIGWLVVYSVLSEELSISFAILYATCIYYFVMKKKLRNIRCAPTKIEQRFSL